MNNTHLLSSITHIVLYTTTSSHGDASRITCVCEGNPLRWRHNGHDCVSNHQRHDCLLNHLFRRRSKKTSKLRVTGLCAGNSPGTGEFPAEMASNAENVSIWWRHHENISYFPSKSSPGLCWERWDVHAVDINMTGRRGLTNKVSYTRNPNWVLVHPTGSQRCHLESIAVYFQA